MTSTHEQALQKFQQDYQAHLPCEVCSGANNVADMCIAAKTIFATLVRDIQPLKNTSSMLGSET